jgi:hypothetical protein
MTDRRALSLTQLVEQCNAHAPNRNKASDGWIGDASHQTTTSDHNPWIYDDESDSWVVSAQDITNDPKAGMPSQGLADALVKSRDERIKYIISNKKICSGTGQSHPAWVWRTYTGSNPHDKHCHISVKSTPEYYDDESMWGSKPPSKPPAGKPPYVPAAPTLPVLQRGSKGPAVEKLQGELIESGYSLRIDGDFGPTTEKAVCAFQYKSHLVVDGIVGSYTWRALAKDKGG